MNPYKLTEDGTEFDGPRANQKNNSLFSLPPSDEGDWQLLMPYRNPWSGDGVDFGVTNIVPQCRPQP
jgi:hypothetical protein